MTCSASLAVRPRCPQCQRALRTCICVLAQPVHSDVQVLILQHPMEVREAKGTARLLHQCLGAASRIEVSEALDRPTLQALLHAPWHPGDAARQALLLYPAGDAAAMPTPPPAPHSLRLVAIDGTWRKSRKMLYANPLLQALPRLALDTDGTGQYRIRKAQRAGQLSTMEATTAALAQLHGWPALSTELQHLQQAFARFLDLHEQQRAHS